MDREYLELWDGREKYDKKDWLRQIDGIEAFKEYITPVHNYICSNMYIAEAIKILLKLDNYDLILLSDIIEHFDREKGYHLKKMLSIILSRNININGSILIFLKY